MFYEEKIINGVLHYRTSPNGQWQPSKSNKAAAINALMLLSDEERIEVFRGFCVHCGDKNPQCVCMKDE
jgi:hypothetical protein